MLEAGGGGLWMASDRNGDGACAMPGMARQRILLVCKSNLERECLFNGLVVNGLKLPVERHASLSAAGAPDGSVMLLLHIGPRRLSDPFFCEELRDVIEAWRPAPVILLAEREEWPQVVRAMEIGVRGYIPTSVDIRVCVEAIHLAAAGGMYFPASMVTKPTPAAACDDMLGELLTAREIEVIHAIRIGKSNKVIAFELGMSEGTVKAHVHNIMKKIGAANRTEVACKLHRMYGGRLVDN